MVKRTSALLALVFAVGLGSLDARAAGGESPVNDAANNDVGNIDSLQRGARNFMNYCAGCHSAKYVRYNTLADGLDLSEEQVVDNLMFAGEKIHDTITVAMPAESAERWFGVKPPDLSLIARSRGSDYIYNFLRTFYVDDSRPSGVNNLVLEATAMPHVLWELQGLRRAVYVNEESADGKPHSVFKEFEQVTEGALSSEEYDRFVRDTVNFLDYISEPMQLERRVLGVWVLMFLVVFLIIAYLLKKEIWKDVK